MIQIDRRTVARTHAFLELGFRPFFLGAAGFAVVAMAIWMGLFTFGWPIRLNGLSPTAWHAHEMIYGYSLAVVAGFLLTAVRKWTDRPTLDGAPLLALVVLWAVGRVVPFLGGAAPLWVAAVTDTAFVAGLLVATTRPVVQARQWGQLGPLAIPGVMLAGDLTFYLGALGVVPNGVFVGLYAGLYLILALIFKMGRRVIPGFIEAGVGYRVRLKNWRWVDWSSLVCFVLFAIADLLTPNGSVVALLAALLVVLHGVRLAGWHTPGLWHKPLLWVLYLGYGSLVAGFALKAAAVVFAISPYLAVHAFTVGGIGMITLGMMARVSLGHTGRNVLDPPSGLSGMFVLLGVTALVRVLVPLLDASRYGLWIGLSQALWIAAFAMFAYRYAPMLIRSSVR